MIKILVVEDEKGIADTVLYALRQEGFECSWVMLGSEALRLQQQNHYDLWVLDIGLPDIDGFEVCRQLRKRSEIPVIFLTARDNEIDRIVGLEIGADDYIAKPFSPRELVARVKVILKRVTRQALMAEATLSNSNARESSLPVRGCFRLDKMNYTITLDNERLPLTRHEYQILSHFMKHPQQVLSRDQLLNAVGISADHGYERTIDTHIKAIRAKIRELNGDIDVIKTHRGFGYRFEPEG